MTEYYDPNSGKKVYYDPLTGRPVGEPAAPEPGLMDKAGSALVDMLPDDLRATLATKAKELFGAEDPKRAATELLFNLPTPIPGPLGGAGSVGQTVEGLPAVGGAVGALAGGVGAVPGSVGGEVLRQGVRKAAGLPPATGIVQEAFGMDPESPEAMATNVGIEAALGGSGSAIAKLAGPAKHGARRSMQNLVQLPEKIRDKPLARGGTKGDELLDRLVSEGIAKPGSTRKTQLARAEKALADATEKAESLQRTLRDKPLTDSSTTEVLETLEKAVPAARRGGDPVMGGTSAKNAEKVLDDATSFLTGGDDVLTVGEVRLEKQRLAEEVSNLFESGADPSIAKKSLARASKAWQKATNTSFPELGEAEMRRSDLITLNKYMRKALNKARYAGADVSAEGVAAGAGAAGRWSVPLMIMGKAAALATAGPLSSMSGAGKRMAHRIFSSPENMQAWVRFMSQLGDTTNTEEGVPDGTASR